MRYSGRSITTLGMFAEVALTQAKADTRSLDANLETEIIKSNVLTLTATDGMVDTSLSASKNSAEIS